MNTQMGCIKSYTIAGIAIVLLLMLAASSNVMAQDPLLAKSFRSINEASESNPTLGKELQAVYESSKRFQDVNVALAEGYIRDPMNMCEDGPRMGLPAHVGAMGIHYFRPDLLQITETEPRVNGTGTHTDFHKPAVLIYEPQADGSLELVGIENLVFIDTWEKKHGKKIPDFMGYEYYMMADNPETEIDEGHMFEPHYDLHVWLYRENPNGMFTQFNPDVTCEHHKMDQPKDMKMDHQKKADKKKSGH